jgi:putative Ca2+/H+ antiporter (TMEM165/GDT1 family)
MSSFVIVPVVVGVLWLAHAFLGMTGSRAYRWTRWLLFAGLPVLAAVMVLSGGMVGFVFALITVLTWLGIAFLEVFLVMGSMVWRDAMDKDPGESAQEAQGAAPAP